MNIPSVSIEKILVAKTDLKSEQGDGQNLFIGREPAKPHNTVTLFDTPDRGPALYYDPEAPRYSYASVQARIRNANYDKAMAQANKLVEVLHNRTNEVIGDTKVTLIQALDEPFLHDWDENNRARVIVNFMIQQTPAPQTV